MGPDPVSGGYAGALGLVIARIQDDVCRQDTVCEDALLVVDVVDEAVECPAALGQPQTDALPFARGNDPGMMSKGQARSMLRPSL